MQNKTVFYLAIAACLASPLALAQGRGGGGPPAGGMQSVNRPSMPTTDAGSFGRDTAQRAAELRSADSDARTSFGSDQSVAAQAEQNETAQDAKQKSKREQAEERTSNDASVEASANASATGEANAAFGQDTAARARLQQDTDVDTRKGFGTTQSDAAKTQAEDRNPEHEDDDDPDDDGE